jgi:sporulation protein YlmC with PRC-barrel domain
MHNDERFGELEALDSWQLVDDKQDIRGREVTSITGVSYGRIEDMLVDKDKEHVAAVRLNDGRLVAVENLEIRTDDVVYHDDGAASRVDYTRVRRPTV